VKRKLKKIDGYFTLEGTKNASERGETLCDHCAYHDCSVRNRIRALTVNQQNAIPEIRACKSLVPILVFQDQSGMEGEFNTLRMGRAWQERLERGSPVALARNDNTLFGAAVVELIVVDTLSSLIDLHGTDNHLAIDARRRGESIDLLKVMVRCYGTNRAKPDQPATAIYLRRL
jgi:hypothetical protein